MNRLLAAIVALCSLTAACGGSADERVASISDLSTDSTLAAASDLAGSGSSNGTAADPEQALLDFTQCMRDNGIDLPDPEVDGDGNLRPARPTEGTFDRAALQAARDTCSHYLDGVTLGFRNFDPTQIEDTLYQYAQCMRDNGYDMPDPDFSGFETPGSGGPAGGGPVGGPFGQISADDPAFQKADAVCRDVFGSLPFGRGPGGGGPGGAEGGNG